MLCMNKSRAFARRITTSSLLAANGSSVYTNVAYRVAEYCSRANVNFSAILAATPPFRSANLVWVGPLSRVSGSPRGLP